MNRPWQGNRWFIDVEGNGARQSEIVELGAVETIDLEPTGRVLRWRIKPKIPIDYYATRVHGIRNHDVAHLPGIETFRPAILRMLQGAAVGGHAVHGDLDIISRDIPGWRPSSAADSLSLSRNLIEKEGGHRLSALVEHFNLGKEIRGRVGGQSHSAVFDALASALVFRTLRDTTDPKIFDHAFIQAESLDRWDGMIRKRKAKAEKAKRDDAKRQIRRQMREGSPL